MVTRADDRSNEDSGRRRAPLLFMVADRHAAMLEALAELVALRERERERQRDHRLDRERSTSRRALAGGRVRGLTIGELDDATAASSLNTRAVDAAIADLGPVDADVRARVEELLAHDHAGIAEAAWSAAMTSIWWRLDDWQVQAAPGRVRYVLTEQGACKLAWARLLTLRGALAILAGYGAVPLGGVDAWWLLLARVWLDDREIGIVISAADRLDAGHTRDEIERALRDVARPPDRVSAGLHHGEGEGEGFARIASKRWDRMKASGWRNTRPAAFRKAGSAR